MSARSLLLTLLACLFFVTPASAYKGGKARKTKRSKQIAKNKRAKTEYLGKSKTPSPGPKAPLDRSKRGQPNFDVSKVIRLRSIAERKLLFNARPQKSKFKNARKRVEHTISISPKNFKLNSFAKPAKNKILMGDAVGSSHFTNSTNVKTMDIAKLQKWLESGRKEVR